jgi:hypothetical protein
MRKRDETSRPKRARFAGVKIDIERDEQEKCNKARARGKDMDCQCLGMPWLASLATDGDEPEAICLLWEAVDELRLEPPTRSYASHVRVGKVLAVNLLSEAVANGRRRRCESWNRLIVDGATRCKGVTVGGWVWWRRHKLFFGGERVGGSQRQPNKFPAEPRALAGAKT